MNDEYIILFNNFGDKYFISINGHGIIKPVYEGLIEVFYVHHNDTLILKGR